MKLSGYHQIGHGPTWPGGTLFSARILYAYDLANRLTGLTYTDTDKTEEDPNNGKWISQDPLGLFADSNPYRFVGNAPTNFTDPSGEFIFLIPAGYFIAAGVIGAIFIFPPEVNPPPNRPPNPGDPIGGALVGMALVGAIEAAVPATASVWAWLRSVGVFGAGAGGAGAVSQNQLIESLEQSLETLETQQNNLIQLIQETNDPILQTHYQEMLELLDLQYSRIAQLISFLQGG